jgi:hypothetical protein
VLRIRTSLTKRLQPLTSKICQGRNCVRHSSTRAGSNAIPGDIEASGIAILAFDPVGSGTQRFCAPDVFRPSRHDGKSCLIDVEQRRLRQEDNGILSHLGLKLHHSKIPFFGRQDGDPRTAFVLGLRFWFHFVCCFCCCCCHWPARLRKKNSLL